MQIQTLPPLRLTLDTLPKMPRVFARALAVAPGRPRRLSPETRIKRGTLYCPNHRVSQGAVHLYNRVCHFQGKDLSPTFIQTLFVPLLGTYIASPLFPITPLGLIQTGQSIAQHRRVTPNEKMDLHCGLLDMEQTERGIRTRFYTEVQIQGKMVWQGISTYFTPHGRGRKKTKRQGDIPLPIQEIIPLAGDTGRQYAKASGDMNPHHLWTPTARLFGFKRPIAHGMWSLGRSFSSLAKNHAPDFPLYLDGEFKLPAFMPGSLTLGHAQRKTALPGKSTVDFELRDQATGRPHLKGCLG